jgi:hypothetical protein
VSREIGGRFTGRSGDQARIHRETEDSQGDEGDQERLTGRSGGEESEFLLGLSISL